MFALALHEQVPERVDAGPDEARARSPPTSATAARGRGWGSRHLVHARAHRGSPMMPTKEDRVQKLQYLGFLGFLGFLGMLGLRDGHEEMFGLFGLFGFFGFFGRRRAGG